MLSAYERVYGYLEEHGDASNSEISQDLFIEKNNVKVYINRLKNRGLIRVDYDENSKRHITVLKEYPEQDYTPKSYKQEVFYEMIEVYRGDFKKCENFRERTAVGAEIRLLFKEM